MSESVVVALPTTPESTDTSLIIGTASTIIRPSPIIEEEKSSKVTHPAAAAASNMAKKNKKNKKKAGNTNPVSSNADSNNNTSPPVVVETDHGRTETTEQDASLVTPSGDAEAIVEDDQKEEEEEEAPTEAGGEQQNKDIHELAKDENSSQAPAAAGGEEQSTSNQSESGELSENAATNNTSSGDTTNKDIVESTEDDTDNNSIVATIDGNAEVEDETDLRNPLRRIWVVTTAAMPWRTGTAVNPLMRALYLTRGRPKHYVTLVVPWLPDVESQQKLFGADHVFSDAPSQEAWIRTFCRTRANCTEEEGNLRIIFYASKYHTVLGSIFPSEDICSLIPDDEADVAILEEPEHLNWFRIPSSLAKKPKIGTAALDENDSDEGEAAEGNGSTQPASKGVEVVYGKEIQLKERNQLGWSTKFRYVVGVLHTNYAAYMGQYGFGTSIIAAPALSLLSSIVVRAYCNRVIRLSAALPPLAPHKEVTSNVHGVRSEFLLPPNPKPTAATTTSPNTATTGDSADNVDTVTTNTPEPYAAVYFIGKVIWAKGFDKVLEVEELYRQKTGQYFAYDIYGGGPDEKAIRRAFFGRRAESAPPTRSASGCESPPSESKELASQVFGSTESLRGLLLQHVLHAKQAFSAAVLECSRDNSFAETTTTAAATNQQEASLERSDTTDDADETTPAVAETQAKKSVDPLSVLGDLSGKSVSTGLAASKAVYKLADKLVKKGISMTFDNVDRGAEKESTLIFSPPQSLYEWRRHPIPARFRGIIDHVEVRDIVENKIFLNMSTTEVLCTTTAEALAMGKFVIIPDHPSNEFFLPFPNCLAYTSIEECVEKLHWALEHDPQPLSEEHARAFSWEGATDRLFEASQMTADEKKKRDVTDKEDKGVARFHVESMIKGHLLTKFFAGEK